jgi:hypothetical protein
MALPSISRTRSSLPDGGGTSAPLPRGTRTVLPPGSLYEPPPLAHFSTVGTLSAVAIPCATAAFTGSGGLAAVAAPVAVADFTAEGTFSVPTNDTNADFTGAGTLTATAIPCALAQFTGEGTVSTGVVATATAAFSGSGALTGPAVPAATAGFTGAGTLSAAAAVFAESGMNKSGTTQQITNAMAVITTWTADTTGYPGSTTSGNALVVNGAGTSKTLSARVAWAPGSGNNHTVSVQIKKNGTLVGTAGTPVTVSPSLVSVTTNVVSGDLITVEVLDTGPWANSGFKATVSTGTGTYVRCLN